MFDQVWAIIKDDMYTNAYTPGFLIAKFRLITLNKISNIQEALSSLSPLMILHVFLIQTIFEGSSKFDDISLYMHFVAKQCTSQ